MVEEPNLKFLHILDGFELVMEKVIPSAALEMVRSRYAVNSSWRKDYLSLTR